MYPSPGQSFLIILQPGHAGFGIDFRRRRLCDFSIAIVSMEFIWWAPFKDRIGSAGTFALAMRGSETVAARACRSPRSLHSLDYGTAGCGQKSEDRGPPSRWLRRGSWWR